MIVDKNSDNSSDFQESEIEDQEKELLKEIPYSYTVYVIKIFPQEVSKLSKEDSNSSKMCINGIELNLFLRENFFITVLFN
jgi:hypothetical protein